MPVFGIFADRIDQFIDGFRESGAVGSDREAGDERRPAAVLASRRTVTS